MLHADRNRKGPGPLGQRLRAQFDMSTDGEHRQASGNRLSSPCGKATFVKFSFSALRICFFTVLGPETLKNLRRHLAILWRAEAFGRILDLNSEKKPENLRFVTPVSVTKAQFSR